MCVCLSIDRNIVLRHGIIITHSKRRKGTHKTHKKTVSFSFHAEELISGVQRQSGGVLALQLEKCEDGQEPLCSRNWELCEISKTSSDRLLFFGFAMAKAKEARLQQQPNQPFVFQLFY